MADDLIRDGPARRVSRGDVSSIAREADDRLRPARDLLVVDAVWPSADRQYTDVGAFGASA